MQQSEFNRAKRYAFQCLNYRPRTIKETQEYLNKKNISPKTIEKIIEYLKDRSYLNDRQFCELWVRDRIKIKPMGKKRIYNELINKGVDPNIILNILEEYLPEELEKELLEVLIQKKMQFINRPDKLKGFLYRRGFEISLVNQIINKYF